MDKDTANLGMDNEEVKEALAPFKSGDKVNLSLKAVYRGDENGRAVFDIDELKDVSAAEASPAADETEADTEEAPIMKVMDKPVVEKK